MARESDTDLRPDGAMLETQASVEESTGAADGEIPDGGGLPRGGARATRPPTDYRRGLRPPQFSVASLMAVMTLVALVLALSDVIGAYGTFWLVVFLVAVLAHVAGNSLGIQLREQGNRPLGRGEAVSFRPARSVRYAPRTRLSDRSAVGFGVVAATLTGSLMGAIGGGYWLVHTLADQFTISSLLVALIAFAVLGGIWSFLTVGFVSVAVKAWRQSSRHR